MDLNPTISTKATTSLAMLAIAATFVYPLEDDGENRRRSPVRVAARSGFLFYKQLVCCVSIPDLSRG